MVYRVHQRQYFRLWRESVEDQGKAGVLRICANNVQICVSIAFILLATYVNDDVFDHE